MQQQNESLAHATGSKCATRMRRALSATTSLTGGNNSPQCSKSIYTRHESSYRVRAVFCCTRFSPLPATLLSLPLSVSLFRARARAHPRVLRRTCLHCAPYQNLRAMRTSSLEICIGFVLHVRNHLTRRSRGHPLSSLQVLLKNLEPAGGLVIEYVSAKELSLESLLRTVEMSFGYEGTAQLFVPADYRSPVILNAFAHTGNGLEFLPDLVPEDYAPPRSTIETANDSSAWQDAVIEHVPDTDSVRQRAAAFEIEVDCDDTLAALLRSWEASATERRKVAVKKLLDNAVQKVDGDSPERRLFGLDQVFEMVSLAANLSSVGDPLLDLLTRIISDEQEQLPIRSKAALVCWHLCQVPQGRFAHALTRRSLHLHLSQALRALFDTNSAENSAAKSESGEARVGAMTSTGSCVGGTIQNAPALKSVSCTGTNLYSAFALSGALVATLQVRETGE